MIFTSGVLFSCLIDIFIGWPHYLFKKIGHPVTWIGFLIEKFDKGFNKSTFRNEIRKFLGVATLIILVMIVGVVSFYAQWLVMTIFDKTWIKILLLAIFFWPFLAFKSMYEHIMQVYLALSNKGILQAREAVSHIVGRSTEKMEEPEIVRASIESLAENTSDGIVAPIFWAILFGLPGIACYKTINTLDSMIGYKSEKYRDFGWASARMDDLVNFLPARLTCLLFAIFSSNPIQTLNQALRDAKRHRSPNAGWPESAMAWSIGIRLSGPRLYDGKLNNEPWINSKGANGEKADILKALRVFKMSMGTFVLALGIFLCFLIYLELPRR